MAKLPFEPPPLVRKLSQRGLDSPNVDDCAFVSPKFPSLAMLEIFSLTSLCIKLCQRHLC